MKEIKDYLHLYLGCQVLIVSNGITNKLVVSSKNHNQEISLAVACGLNVKPILRPLSSMTGEEFNEFKVLCDNDFSKMVVIESVSKDGDFTRLCHQATSQAYMLSKHFDLFGLIELGLAIDATNAVAAALLSN